MEVKYQRRKEGGFKCKYERANNNANASSIGLDVTSNHSASPTELDGDLESVGRMNTMRASESKILSVGPSTTSTKFRIDILGDEDDPNGLRILFIQQQGIVVIGLAITYIATNNNN